MSTLISGGDFIPSGFLTAEQIAGPEALAGAITIGAWGENTGHVLADIGAALVLTRVSTDSYFELVQEYGTAVEHRDVGAQHRFLQQIAAKVLSDYNNLVQRQLLFRVQRFAKKPVFPFLYARQKPATSLEFSLAGSPAVEGSASGSAVREPLPTNAPDKPKEDDEARNLADRRRRGLLDAAQTELLKRHWNLAIEAFENLRFFEDQTYGRPSSEGFFGAARALRKAKRFDEAENVLQTAIRLFPNNPHLPFHLAKVYRDSGRHDRAVSILTDLLGRQELQSEEEVILKNKALVARAVVHMKGGQVKEALEDVMRACQQVDLAPSLLNQMLSLLKKEGDREKIAEFLNLIPPAKKRKMVMECRGRVDFLIKQRLYAEALSHLDAIAEIQGDKAEPRDLAERGYVLTKLERYSDALNDLNQAIQQSERKIPEHFAKRGVVLRHLHRYEKAYTDFKEALRLEQETAEGVKAQTLCELGITLSLMHKWEEAVEVFTQSLAKGSNHPRDLFERGRALFALGRYPEARDDLAEAVRTDRRGNIVAEFILADIYGALNDIKNALETLKRIENHGPKNVGMISRRASLHRRRGNLQLAVDDLEKAEALVKNGTASPVPNDKTLGHLYLTKGLVLIALRQYNEALAALNQAIRHFGDRPDAMENKIFVLNRLGRTEEAKALQRKPHEKP